MAFLCMHLGPAFFAFSTHGCIEERQEKVFMPMRPSKFKLLPRLALGVLYLGLSVHFHPREACILCTVCFAHIVLTRFNDGRLIMTWVYEGHDQLYFFFS
jgi:hypothetical protein